ncbi:hypothetical protein [Dehalogenimonas sp. 4OHTPN]|uniref:DUF2680 domain-containing protein n=1 Tax=Dehalogenimonas sp. 4OHTPN TaxID=3166643 RepID=A0AAU8GE51_9CHLR
MKTLPKKWLVGIVVVAVGLLAIGVPVLASAGNNPFGTSGASNTYDTAGLDSPTLARVAGILGLTPADLTTQLQAGKTLAVIAGERNIPTATLVEAIIAPYAEQVALQVKYGYITQEQAQTILNAARQNAGNLLSQNLSSAGGYNGLGHCGGYLGEGIGAGHGWGIMGPGMMGGWGNNAFNTTNGNAVPAQPWNGGTGWGMSGMMGGW